MEKVLWGGIAGFFLGFYFEKLLRETGGRRPATAFGGVTVATLPLG